MNITRSSIELVFLPTGRPTTHIASMMNPRLGDARWAAPDHELVLAITQQWDHLVPVTVVDMAPTIQVHLTLSEYLPSPCWRGGHKNIFPCFFFSGVCSGEILFAFVFATLKRC